MTVFRGLLLVLLTTMSSWSDAADFDHRHRAWTELLAKYVEQDGAVSYVDYKGLRKDPEPLNGYLATLSSVSKPEYEGWTGQQRLAFLINAYNAFTVKLIVDHYPVDSIKDLGGWLSSPWKKRFFNLLGEERNLDDIEHGMIRQDFAEPRIHFAVNCASKGCPFLRGEAYVAARLDEQLEDNTRTFLRDQRRNRYHADRALLEVTPLFKWYGGDFVKAAGSLEAFIAPRISDDSSVIEAIRSGDVRIRFLDYDWSLNER